MDRQRAFKLITVLGAPLVVVVVAELALAVSGYPTTYEREDPFLGFEPVTSLFEVKPDTRGSGRGVYATRRSKLAWFNHQEFALDKPDDGYRVFSLGGSTTFGRPYRHETSFSSWLAVLLGSASPSASYEVVNAGGVSYASYRLVHLMREMVDYEPDLFIVYTGHNEFLEERTYSDLRDRSPVITRVRSGLHRSRSYSLARDLWIRAQGRERAEAEGKFRMSGEVTAILDQSFGLEHYRRDPEKHDAVLSHFRFNLERMVDLAEDHGVPLLFVVPASNEGAFSPFKSQPCSPGGGSASAAWRRSYDEGRARLSEQDYRAAADLLRRAATLEPCHADLRYRLAQAYRALGSYEDAKREFLAARDLDVAPLRATTRIQETVRDVAARRGVPTVDLAAILEQDVRDRSGHSILGEEAFLDHVHPTIPVHRRLAEALVGSLVRQRWIDPERPLQAVEAGALYDSVMATLDGAYHATRDLNLAKVLSWLGKEQEAAPFVARAAEGLPDHPEAQYLRGVLFQGEGRYAQAEEAYRTAVGLDSTFARAHTALASVYERTGRLEEAIASIRRALRYEPESDNAHFSLGNVLYGTGRPADAVAAYREALRLNPRNSQAWNNLAAVYITMGRYDEAIEALGRTLELDPGNVNAFRNLGLSHYNAGRWAEARRMFERALEMRPDDGYAVQWLRRLDREGRQ